MSNNALHLPRWRSRRRTDVPAQPWTWIPWAVLLAIYAGAIVWWCQL